MAPLLHVVSCCEVSPAKPLRARSLRGPILQRARAISYLHQQAPESYVAVAKQRLYGKYLVTPFPDTEQTEFLAQSLSRCTLTRKRWTND